ncbi:MAG: glycosyltransferase family 2 protein [Eubacteriales bacterium]|nr:glycosyltransferase family 2 protein [Eubacteriales bacterium]
MIDFINNFNFLLFLTIAILYFYQGVYMVLSMVGKAKRLRATKNNRYAVIIPARNEEKVIPHLIDSLKRQNYPAELLDVFVIADNCTDRTAAVCRAAGARVYERFNKRYVGKGYALHEFFKVFDEKYGFEAYDGYFLFDADNLADENYVKEMNAYFDNGFRIVTGYRSSKNFGDTWVSAGSGTWFLRDCVFMHRPRMMCHTTANITGTGFLMSAEIVRKNGGWKHFLLTEDIEFSVDMVLQDEVIGFAERAIYYDEQPLRFRESWTQRMRWVKGFYQVLRKYGLRLVKRAFIDGSFGNYDMFMLVAPGNILAWITILVNLIFFFIGVFDVSASTEVMAATAQSLLGLLRNVFLVFMAVGAATTIREWRRIPAKPARKLLNILTFPIYMISYIPISLIAVWKKVKWVPIEHSEAMDISEIK